MTLHSDGTASAPAPAPPRRPRALNVVRDPAPEELGARIDWSAWYLTDEDDVGEGNEQSRIIDVARSSLRELLRERGLHGVHVGSDQFFAWLREEPLVRVSPDVYLLDDPPAPPLPPSWQTWKPGHRPPRLAIEIVSPDERHPERWRKDYDEGPEKYAQLGTRELVIFDPEAACGRAGAPGRVALQQYRREADGSFVRTYAGAGPVVQAAEIEAWLAIQRVGPIALLRVARDAEGRDLVPTEAERAERAERRAEQEARQREQEARRAQEAERRAEQEARQREQEARRAQEAERRLAAALAELERSKRGG
jgi:Uma2 family endonuclease